VRVQVRRRDALLRRVRASHSSRPCTSRPTTRARLLRLRARARVRLRARARVVLRARARVRLRARARARLRARIRVRVKAMVRAGARRLVVVITCAEHRKT
jgi:hypothetical protein